MKMDQQYIVRQSEAARNVIYQLHDISENNLEYVTNNAYSYICSDAYMCNRLLWDYNEFRKRAISSYSITLMKFNSTREEFCKLFKTTIDNIKTVGEHIPILIHDINRDVLLSNSSTLMIFDSRLLEKELDGCNDHELRWFVASLLSGDIDIRRMVLVDENLIINNNGNNYHYFNSNKSILITNKEPIKYPKVYLYNKDNYISIDKVNEFLRIPNVRLELYDKEENYDY